MNAKRAQSADVGALVSTYAKAASAHVKSTTEGDFRAANRQADVISIVYRELRSRGHDAQRAFGKQLMNMYHNSRRGSNRGNNRGGIEGDGTQGTR